MFQTSASLLERLAHPSDEQAWQRLVDLYTPLLRGWLSRQDLQPADADDLVQEVVAVVVRELPHFEHNHRPGAFRSWLRAILTNRLRAFWKARQHQPLAIGSSEFQATVEQLADDGSGLSRLWDDEHNRHVVRQLLEQIRGQVAPNTWSAFCKVALEGKTEESVAAELGLSVNAVFIAKSRVLNRLRQEGRGLID
jgi:RNA polymerase sigma-70 factor (ECF subfamily)